MIRWMFAAALLSVVLVAPSAYAGGTLFVGSDVEDFGSTLPDRLGRFATTGAAIDGGSIISTPYAINGMTNAGAFLYAGDALSSTLRTIDFNGALLSAIPAGFPAGCCNEDMVFFGGTLYHAHWETNIQQIDPATGAVLATFPQADVVGMTLVDGEIWISKWSARQVGRWAPGTNTFTPVFTTPTNAGGLAYDANDNVLWVGRQGGFVEPRDLSGVLLGPGFQPFGDIGDTIDGLEFVCTPVVSSLSASPNSLWPPNHKLVDVTVLYNLPSCRAATTCTLGVTSNEPANAKGDGNTAVDFEIAGPNLVRLRAERSGKGSGRIYTITATCTDALGQTAMASTQVTVPHDQGR